MRAQNTYIIGDWCPSHLQTPPSIRIPREMTHFVGPEVMTLANIYVYYARLVSLECRRSLKYFTHSQIVTRKQFDRELLRIRRLSKRRKRRKHLTASGHFKICLTNWKYRRRPLTNNVNLNTVYTYYTGVHGVIIDCHFEHKILSRLNSGSNLATTHPCCLSYYLYSSWSNSDVSRQRCGFQWKMLWPLIVFFASTPSPHFNNGDSLSTVINQTAFAPFRNLSYYYW